MVAFPVKDFDTTAAARITMIEALFHSLSLNKKEQY